LGDRKRALRMGVGQHGPFAHAENAASV
jgi:hypothetical protein